MKANNIGFRQTWEAAEVKCQTVLVYRLGSLGDTIVALPAFRVIEKSFPGARRVLLTNFSVGTKASPVAEILNGTGIFDEYIEYPLKLRNWLRLAMLILRLRKLRADALVYMAAPRGRIKTFRDAIFFWACGISKIIGLPNSPIRRRSLPLSNGMFEYEGARILRNMEALGPADLCGPQSFDIALSKEEYMTADHLLMTLGGAPFFAVSIGSKTQVKDWGDDRWKVLLRNLGKKFPDWSVVMVGATDERYRSEMLATCWEGRHLNLCGIIPVRVSGAVLSRARLYIGHDSGPMHLASAVGTPCVAIFSSQNLPGEWFPYGNVHKVLYHEIECQGCRLSECIERQKACIRSIEVEEVEAAVLDILGR